MRGQKHPKRGFLKDFFVHLVKRWLLIKKPYILGAGWFLKNKVISRVILVKYYCVIPVGIWQQKHWLISLEKYST